MRACNYHFRLSPLEILAVRGVATAAAAATAAVVPCLVNEERLLDEHDVVLGHTEAVVVGGTVLVAGGDGRDYAARFQDHCTLTPGIREREREDSANKTLQISSLARKKS